MGGAVSAGRDNNELVEKLISIKYLRTHHIQRVFRAVDRGDYFLPTEIEHAYMDLAWKSGLLHLSAPCIYCDVMEALKLKPGLSFLNLGSGTGYLSTMAGLILGNTGVNHGVELHDVVVEYANKKLYEFIKNSPAVDEFDFCEPKFVVGNCLCLPPTTQLYDRVYCGAACPKEHETYFKKLIKIGGTLVMPLDDYLLRIKRTSEDNWDTQKLLHVSFSTLIIPKEFKCVDLPNVEPATLMTLCRASIRKELRCVITREQPAILETLMKTEAYRVKRKSNFNRTKTLCIAIDEDNNSEDEFDVFNNIHNLDLESGSREMNALLRLVLRMGNQSRDVFVRNFENANAAVYDEEITSSEEESFISDYYSSGSSTSNNGMADNENDDILSINSDPIQVRVNFQVNDTPGPSRARAQDAAKKECDCINCDGGDVNVVDNGSDGKVETNTSSSILNPTEHKSKDIGNKRKIDSGIGDDAPNASCNCNASTSSNNASIQMDTSSSDDLYDSSDNINNKDENWCQRKRHLPDDRESNSDRGDTTDCEEENRGGSQSKVKCRARATPHPYDFNRKKLTELLQAKIQLLSLPPLLRKYVNMNRDIPD